MKKILHSDYWVEIPAGEFLVGLSQLQEDMIASRLREQAGWDYYPKWKEQLKKSHPAAKFNLETIWLERYYIARFPITAMQLDAFVKGQEPSELPGVLEEPIWVKSTDGDYEYPGRQAAMVQSLIAQEICKALGARTPSSMEWEKAARGTDGRLYPWGNEWDSTAGFFYYGRNEVLGKELVVDAFPSGVSPYGIWAMMGSLPQMVVDASPYEDSRGCAPSETTPEMAWLDNIIPFARKRGDYMVLRPVLNQWPRQQWQGHTVSKDQTN